MSLTLRQMTRITQGNLQIVKKNTKTAPTPEAILHSWYNDKKYRGRRVSKIA